MTTATWGRGVAGREQGEGALTREIERYTIAVPSGTYLSLAIGSIGLSLALELAGASTPRRSSGSGCQPSCSWACTTSS